MIAFVFIIPAFREHIVYHPDGQQIQFADGKTQLYTPEQEQGCCHFPVSWANSLFLDIFQFSLGGLDTGIDTF